jgi:hypothetical protein
MLMKKKAVTAEEYFLEGTTSVDSKNITLKEFGIQQKGWLCFTI